MAIWLKRGATAEAKRDADRKVRDIVEAALAEIEARGDDAVREMSVKFDNWDREDYRLSQAEIDNCVARLTPAGTQGYRIRADAGAQFRGDSARQHDRC